jgi:hypothetical protein
MASMPTGASVLCLGGVTQQGSLGFGGDDADDLAGARLARCRRGEGAALACGADDHHHGTFFHYAARQGGGAAHIQHCQRERDGEIAGEHRRYGPREQDGVARAGDLL